MEITTTTRIRLINEEIAALELIKNAYVQCVTNDCFECDECPLYVDEGCIGMFADNVLSKLKGGKS